MTTDKAVDLDALEASFNFYSEGEVDANDMQEFGAKMMEAFPALIALARRVGPLRDNLDETQERITALEEALREIVARAAKAGLGTTPMGVIHLVATAALKTTLASRSDGSAEGASAGGSDGRPLTAAAVVPETLQIGTAVATGWLAQDIGKAAARLAAFNGIEATGYVVPGREPVTPYAQGYKDGVEAAAAAIGAYEQTFFGRNGPDWSAGHEDALCRAQAIIEALPIPAGEPGPSRAEIVEALRPYMRAQQIKDGEVHGGLTLVSVVVTDEEHRRAASLIERMGG